MRQVFLVVAFVVLGNSSFLFSSQGSAVSAEPETVFRNGFEAFTIPVTSAGPNAPWTKIASPDIVHETTGDPAGMLIVKLPCFVTSGLVAIEEGDVLATAIGPATPNGLLRRVISISICEGGYVLLTTEPATLADALPAGTLELTSDLSGLVVPPLEPTTEDGTIEPTDQPLNINVPAASGAVGTFADPGRFSYGCGESGVKLTVKPIFSFDPEVTFSADWGANDEVHVQIGLALQGEFGGEFSATGSVECEAKFALLDGLSLGKQVIFIGPLPVVVEPKLSVAAKLTGKAETALKTTMSSTGSVGAILALDREPGFEDVIWDLQPSGNFGGFLDFEIEGKIQAGFVLSPSIGFLLYGVVAPTAAVSAGRTVKFEPCETPNLTLHQPASLDVSLKPSAWFGEMLKPLTVFDIELGHSFLLPGSPYLLYSADIPTSIPCVVATDLPEGMVGEPYVQAITIVIPPLANNPTYTVTGGALPPNLILTADGMLQGTPTQSGTYLFDATATHTLGTSSGKFRITIQPPTVLEITTMSLPGGTVGKTYVASLQANRPPGELSWSLTGGSLPDGVMLSANGSFSGTPTAAGNYPVTIQATHAISSQTAQKLFSIVVNEDIGGVVLGAHHSPYPPAADVSPDGSAATILFQDWDEENSSWARLRLVKVGPDGQVDFDVDIPGRCIVDPACQYGLGYAKTRVQIMPDGGAAVAFLADDPDIGIQPKVLRYGPTGSLLWQYLIPNMAERSHIAGFEVAPDGRIALATFETSVYFASTYVLCDDGGVTFLGSRYLELDAYGSNLQDADFRTSANCAEAAAGLGQTQTWISGLTLNTDGNFVGIGVKFWLKNDNYIGPFNRPAVAFRMDINSLQPVAVPTGKLPLELAASGSGLYTALGVDQQGTGVAAPLVLGNLVGTMTNALAAPLECAFVSGVAGTPGSLLAVCEHVLQRMSDLGALVTSRTLPSDRTAVSAVAGLGGQVYTVEQRLVDPGLSPYEIVRAVLNPDLTDPD